MTALPVVSCIGCGACCLEQHSPPGYVGVLSGVWTDPDDVARVNNLPPALRKELEDYAELIRRGEPHPNHGVCIWFDQETLGCKHHEHRPEICRDFEIGSPACHRWRSEYGVHESPRVTDGA